MKKILLSLFAALLFVSAASAQTAGQTSDAGKRLTPEEIKAIGYENAGAGSSGVSGIETRILNGDPTKPGLYTIQLTVPANTRIQAHSHPDDRIATVVSGTWYIGYGDKADEKKFKALKPGSFYTEPPDAPHFARTGKTPVVVQITGYGPTGTEYVKQ
jgi:quercetin dioxygenase-like cupin family protein